LKLVAGWCCVVLIGCGGGKSVIDRPGNDASTSDGSERDAPGGDAHPGKAIWSAWPLPNHDPANTRRSPNVGPQAPIDRFVVDVLAQELVIGVDGMLYATNWGDNHPIVALDPATGTRRWTFAPTPSASTTVPPFSPSIAAGPEGTLYAAYQQGGVYALDGVDGSVRWQFTTGKTGPSGDLSQFGPPLVDSDGRVYVGEASVVYAFESDGRPAWRYDARSIQGASPTGIDPGGTVYVQEAFGALHALGRDGTPRWTLPVTPALSLFAGLIVRDDGTLLFGALGERQYGVVSAAGVVLWQHPGAFTGFALGSDGAFYAGDVSGVLRLDSNGSIVWQGAAGGRGTIVDGAGTVYSASTATITAVDASGILKWELHTADPAIPGSAPAIPRLYAIGGDGTLYVGINGSVHAIGGGGRCEGSPIDCDDQDPCTVDRCDRQAGCVHAARCVPAGTCTIARCAADGTCTFTPVADGTVCDDGIFCGQGDTCRAGQCAPATSSCSLVGPWPTSGHDAQQTHATPLLGPGAPPPRGQAAGPSAANFVIAGDGTLYATGGGQVRTISATGVVTPFASVAAIDLVLRPDGGLYATTPPSTGVLHALGADGTPQWTFTAAPVWPPAIGPSGAIYAATRRDLIALAPDGSTLWKVATGGGLAARPVVGLDGNVYALCPDLWMIAPDGRVKWKRSVGWASGLVVGPTGRAFVLLDGSVSAIDANGVDAWTWSLGASATFAPALSHGGDLILTAGETIYRLDTSTGALRSSLTPPAPPKTRQQLVSPIIDGDDVLFVVANAVDSDSFQPLTQATLFAIDRSDRVLWTYVFPRTTGASGANLVIGPSHTLYLIVNGVIQTVGP
jgi:outer membrane protein assembly factor BamB